MRFPVVVPFVLVLASSTAGQAAKICIDPGHGGGDPGGVGCGLEEEDIVLDTSLRLRDLLQANGFQVVMTRTNDTFVELGARADFANAQGADRFASIHANAFGNNTANGTETFCHTSGGTSVDMRDRIQTEMIQAWGLTDRGGKTADFAVLRETVMPATLSELGFVTNCSVDAAVMNDPNNRQEAAQAHLEAIAAHLNIELDGNDPPPPLEGTMNGVVFEDQGVGTDNMDIRLVGATVLVVDTGETIQSNSDGGAWTFSLPAGEHTIRASLDGYTTNERTCTVVAGDIAWCSIGLFPAPVAGEGEGEGEGPVGEGEGEEPVGEGEGEGEGEPVGPPVQQEIDRVTILPPLEGEGGCSSTNQSFTLVAFVALLALLARRRSLVALVVVLGATSANAQTITDAHVAARGLYTAALLSPAGDRVLVAEDRYAGLSVIDLRSNQVRMLTETVRAGFRAVWVDDTHVAYRNPARPFDGDPLVTLNLDGEFTGPHIEKARARQLSRDGDVHLVEVNGAVVSRADDRCFAPIVSSRGDVLFQCLRTGLYLHGATSKTTTSLGQGTAPSFSADGRFAIFAVQKDEGHVAVESDIVLVDLRNARGAPKVVPLAKTPAIERSPSLSADGSRIAWLVDDKVMVARLTVR